MNKLSKRMSFFGIATLVWGVLLVISVVPFQSLFSSLPEETENLVPVVIPVCTENMDVSKVVKKNLHEEPRTVKSKTAPSFSQVELQMQNPELPNGCEVTSLAMVLSAAGYPVDKLELYEYLPRASFSYSENERLGPDPHQAYAGSADSVSGGWYCLEGPIIEAGNSWIQETKRNAQMSDLTGIDRDAMDNLLEKGIPLVVWVTQDYAPPTYAEYFPWTLSDGSQYVPYDNLHCVVVGGVENEVYQIADPIRGWQQIEKEVFWESFDAMGCRAVTVRRDNIL